MSITRICNGCGERIPGAQAGALSVQRDENPGALRTPVLAELDRTDWCKRCAAPILAALGESLTRARQARERRMMGQRAQSLDVDTARLPVSGVPAVRKNLERIRHLRLTR